MEQELAIKVFLLGMVAGGFMLIVCEWIGAGLGRLLALWHHSREDKGNL